MKIIKAILKLFLRKESLKPPKGQRTMHPPIDYESTISYDTKNNK